MITIYEDPMLSFRVRWDQMDRFLVTQEYVDGSSIEVDVFDVVAPAPMTYGDAEITAKQYCDMVRKEFSGRKT